MSDQNHLAAGTPEEREALGFKAWPESGVQTYRVQYQNTAGGLSSIDVEAATGNEAAEKALRENGGGKVTNIAPAPQRPKLKVKAD